MTKNLQDKINGFVMGSPRPDYKLLLNISDGPNGTKLAQWRTPNGQFICQDYYNPGLEEQPHNTDCYPLAVAFQDQVRQGMRDGEDVSNLHIVLNTQQMLAVRDATASVAAQPPSIGIGGGLAIAGVAIAGSIIHVAGRSAHRKSDVVVYSAEESEGDQGFVIDTSDSVALDGDLGIAGLESHSKPDPLEGDWLQELLYHPDMTLRQQHIAIFGPQRSGKSRLAKHIVNILDPQKERTQLFTPKHDWDFPPSISSAVDYIPGLESINSDLTGIRAKDPVKWSQFIQYVVLEEMSVVSSVVPPKDLKQLLAPILYMGSSCGVQAVIVDQSSLCRYADSSMWRQCARIAIGAEAERLLISNGLCLEKDYREHLKAQARYYKENDARYALVVPVADTPKIVLIPDLEGV